MTQPFLVIDLYQEVKFLNICCLQALTFIQSNAKLYQMLKCKPLDLSSLQNLSTNLPLFNVLNHSNTESVTSEP